ncbi:HD domain-containing phosphohydrolase [Bdellovibrionota bacterium FG-1]
MRVLLLQDDEVARERVAFVLESQFNATVIQVSTPQEALKILEHPGADLNLLVIDCERSKELDRLRSKATEIQSIVFYHGKKNKPVAISAPPGRPNPVVIERADIIESLSSAIHQLVVDEKLPRSEDDRNFCKIRTKLLLSVCPLQSDIFIRLSESKYLKLFREGDTFDLQDMEKYTVRKGVEYLFLRKTGIQQFIQKYQDELLLRLNQKAPVQLEDAIEQNEAAFETIHELGHTLGFTKEVQEAAKTQVQVTMKAIGNSPKLSKLMEKLDSFKGKYISAHSMMVGYVACAIASQLKWGSNTTFHKLNLAAFLHDITLNNHDLARCKTIAEAKEGNFTDAEKQSFAKHPSDASELVKRFNEIPPDVDIIIAQHHELPSGEGFPRRLQAHRIAPLSALFIVAHDLTDFALSVGKGAKVGHFLAQAKEKYTPSQFRKAVEALEQVEDLEFDV